MHYRHSNNPLPDPSLDRGLHDLDAGGDARIDVDVEGGVGTVVDLDEDALPRTGLSRVDDVEHVPTRHLGETITRFAFVNPRTTIEDVRAILDTMA